MWQLPLDQVKLYQVSWWFLWVNLYITDTFHVIICAISDLIIAVLIIVSKGISSHLMKFTSKRRRTKQEIKDQKRSEDQKQKEIAEKMDAFS